MKTKFILHGGFSGEPSLENDKFFKEILKNSLDKIHILLVFFAKTEEKYPRSQSEIISQFTKNNENKELFFEIAAENNFEEQIKRSNVVYLYGGETLKLLEALKKFPNLHELLEGKTVIGDSAGAYVLSTYFYSETEGGLLEGLGFVPVKTICHYTGVNEEKLSDCPENLETLLLGEFEYKVFE